MEIKYLTLLAENKAVKSKHSDFVKTLIPISEDEIFDLERTYNNGNSFPVVLKELLYLAGNYCYVLDYSLCESQEELQSDAREFLTDHNYKVINRPFYVVEIDYDNGYFVFVYLDEDQNDPELFIAMPWRETAEWISKVNQTLSQLIITRIELTLAGK